MTKTPQIKSDWATGGYIGNGVIPQDTKVKLTDPNGAVWVGRVNPDMQSAIVHRRGKTVNADLTSNYWRAKTS
jgi:hypothetical protein